MTISYRQLRVGDEVAMEARGGIVAEELPAPEWYILRAAPKAELAAIAWLARNGVPDAWCPTETRWRTMPRGRRKKVPYEAPLAPGYVFAPFTRRPVWHVLRERAKGKLTGVVARQGIPLVIPEPTIARMKHVPGRIAAIRKREEERRRIRPGDRVDVVSGPLAGWTIEVSRIHAGIAYFVAPLLGEREVSVPAERLRKVRD